MTLHWAPEGTVLIPIAEELVEQLRQGVTCAGLQLVAKGEDAWELIVYCDADLPFAPYEPAEPQP